MNDIYTIGNYVEIPEDSDICLHDVENTLVFVGKMSYAPNIVAMKFFIDNVYYQLKQHIPDLRLIIVGANPTPEIIKYNRIEGIEVTGFVNSVFEYYKKASIVIAPMLTGAGIQNKIIQGMSYGCCVVTTPIGAEGLNIRNNEIAIVSGKDKWISELRLLLANKSARLKMGELAREYVKNNLSYDFILGQFEKFIEAGYGCQNTSK